MVTSDGCSGWSHGAVCGVAFHTVMILSEYLFTLPPSSFHLEAFRTLQLEWTESIVSWKASYPSNLFTECVY